MHHVHESLIISAIDMLVFLVMIPSSICIVITITNAALSSRSYCDSTRCHMVDKSLKYQNALIQVNFEHVIDWLLVVHALIITLILPI